MTSQDNAHYVTVEMFNNGMAVVNQRLDKIDQTLEEMRSEFRLLDRNVAVNGARIEMLQHTFYCGLAIIAIAAALAPLFKHEKTDKPQPEVTRSDVQSMIDAAISRALNAKQ